jgi:uncharacterized lipoprotein YmbA
MNTAMHITYCRRLGFALLLAPCSLLLTACSILPEPQADPVRHFTLSGPLEDAPRADAPTVRPVRLAGHLRNRSMAVRVSENEVVYRADVRWAEPLDEAITQVLRHRLQPLGGGAVVNVQVQRCELVRSAGDQVQLAATYTIAPRSGDSRSGTFTATPRSWSGGDTGELVGLIQAAVNELADALAAEVGK